MIKVAPKSPNRMLVFRNYSFVVAKSKFERLSGMSVWLANPSIGEPYSHIITHPPWRPSHKPQLWRLAFKISRLKTFWRFVDTEPPTCNPEMLMAWLPPETWHRRGICGVVHERWGHYDENGSCVPDDFEDAESPMQGLHCPVVPIRFWTICFAGKKNLVS